MAKKRNELMAGCFVIAMVALAVAVLLWVSNVSRMTGQSEIYQVAFPYALGINGLRKNGDVTLGGHVIGKIKAIEAGEIPVREQKHGNYSAIEDTPEEPVKKKPAGAARKGQADETNKVTKKCWLVKMEIDAQHVLRQREENIEKGIVKDYPVISINAGLIGGLAVMNISHLGSGGKISEVIIGQPASSPLIADMANTVGFTEKEKKSVSEIIEKLRGIAEDAKIITGKLRDDYNDVVGKVNLTLDNLNASLVDVKKLTARLANLTIDEEYDIIVGKVNSGLDQVNDFLVEIERFRNDQLRPLFADLQTAAAEIRQIMAENHDRINSTVANIYQISEEGRDVVHLSKGQILEMVDNMKELSIHLKAAGKDIRRSPWRLLYQPDDRELETSDLLAAARAYSEAAVQVDDAATLLQALTELSGQPDARHVQDALEQLNSSMDRLKEIEPLFLEQMNQTLP